MKEMKWHHKLAATCVLAAAVVTGITLNGSHCVAGELPDGHCTPGAVNPNITQANLSDTLCNPNWHTSDVRDTESTATQKEKQYAKYGVSKPQNNIGQNQVCELDHLISLELGGADSLDNIWPECGPVGVSLSERYFKQKDKVENWLHAQICNHALTLAEAQHGIASNWLQYLPQATKSLSP